MDFGGDVSVFGMVFQVSLIDLLMSGDNAVVIALACRSLAPEYLRKAVLYGTGAAILLRIFLTTVVGFLLAVPGLKLLGGVALVIIAIKLMVAEDDAQDGAEAEIGGDGGLLAAVGVIFVADLVMSLDNVVALSAVAQGNISILAFGLLFSIPLLMYGSSIVTGLLHQYPLLISAGGALLGWLAGDIAITDPLIADWVRINAPALGAAMPVLGAMFVLLESRIVERDIRGNGPRPSRPIRPRPVIAAKPPTIATPPEAPPEKVTTASDNGADAALAFFNRYPLPIIVGVALLSWLAGGLLLPGFGLPMILVGVVLVGAAAVLLFRGRARTDDPALPEAALQPTKPPDRETALAAGALILIAESDAAEQAGLKQSLEWLGFAAETAADGQEAWELLAQRDYGLLITSCYMPRLNGFKLTTRLREAEAADPAARRLPIIAFVAQHQTLGDLKQRYIDAGMDDCLSKPPGLQGIEDMVARWLPAAAALRQAAAEPAAKDANVGMIECL